MDMNIISTRAEKDGALLCPAQFVRILMVDYDTASLMSFASKFEKQLYKVTTTESATIALSLFQVHHNYYDIVIADIRMLEMGVSEFVEKLHGQRMSIPIILIAEDSEIDSVRQTLGNGVCFILSKPISNQDITNVWQHIPRVTGKMPAFFDMGSYNDTEKDVILSSDSSNGDVVGNQKWMKLINKENIKRKKNQTTETSNTLNDTKEEDCHQPKKPCFTWNFYLHEKFLHAINIIGEHGARPKKILSLMKEPGLTYRHVSSHLQIYRKQKRHTLSNPDMPALLPMPSLNTTAQGKSSGTASLNGIFHYDASGNTSN